MGTYRKQPVEIEAFRWDGTDAASFQIRQWAEPDVAIIDTIHIQHLWDYDAGCYILPSGKMVHAPFSVRCLIIATLEGMMIAKPGWWIIRGVRGEFYPCEPEIFEETYEKVEEK